MNLFDWSAAMIPEDRFPVKPQFPPLVPLDVELTYPDNDDAPACCPRGFCRKASGLLDMVELAQAVLSDLKAALENEVLP
jgi:hypothetical protein